MSESESSHNQPSGGEWHPPKDVPTAMPGTGIEDTRKPMIAQTADDDGRLHSNAHLGRVIRVQDLRRALDLAHDTYGPSSQAAFAIEAIIRACE